MRITSVIALALWAMWLSNGPALAEKRVALVIGNADYQRVPVLANPARDADDMSEMFRRAGFSVVQSRHNLGVSEMRRALRDFADEVRDADVAIIFYAGHGMEVDGMNYLIPVDAQLERDIDAYDEAIPLDRLLTVMEPAKQLRLIILDACRDNPFSKTMKRSSASRAVSRGLARIEPDTSNTLVAFAAKAGFTASDGGEQNSPYTSALLRYLPQPGLDVRRALGFVRDEVVKFTHNRQEPFIYGSLGGDDVALVPAPAAKPAIATPNAGAREDYELAQQVNVVSVWDAFIGKYPSGFYADLARAQREKLIAAKAAADEQARLTAQKKALDDANAAEAERAKVAAELKAADEARIAAETARAQEEARAAEAARAKAAAQARIDEIARVAALAVGNPAGPDRIQEAPRPSSCASNVPPIAAPSARTAQGLSPTEECALKPRDVFRDCENCPEMVVVPAGQVLMGSSTGDINNGLAAANEWPQHQAAVKQPIAVGRFEITRDQFEAFVSASGYRPGERCYTFEQGQPQERNERSFRNPGFAQAGNHPAVCINWTDAKAYVQWLSRTTGKTYRLLTETEFEYVARAGSRSRFGFGDDVTALCKFANGADRAAKGAGLPADTAYLDCSDGFAFTAPVGSFAANAFGLDDVIGNVWEWTEDCFYGDYATASADRTARADSGCTSRTVRGGDWFSTEASLRPAARAKANIEARHDDIGFRVARTLGP
ncbi:MAG: SUMF1/EgtB/PvdO family nonheme iron enzyme [Bradyrhizobium sp.]|uniref:SUMF1/EgtB/PvdO family nonheme iron enzyme n=1 Tax=Bradyrhizobium sp. TaxID=376 RepID=UPI001D4E790F|nr:SUMF1/EgtB/PvdO family nonheme iron enzyme [Bradyrhizobium sp.]MBV9563938.1 SUMF1/EgtB/PvdO family nonheme iron enzyme [Bradyrhizobium sp.]